MRECEHKDSRLAAWVDGELEEEEQKELASHILLCRDCAAEVGQMAAQKVLCRRPIPEGLTVPRDLWKRITEELNHVDGVQRALSTAPRPRRSLVPVLAVVGVILIAAALYVRAVLLAPSLPLGEQLLRLHGQALGASGIYLLPNQLHAVGISVNPLRPRVRWQAVGTINGQFVVHRLCTSGHLPFSLISGPPQTLPLSALRRVVVGGQAYYVDETPNGAVVVAVREGIEHIFVAFTTLDDLLQIASNAVADRAFLSP